jgi:Tol biopolymer transport system component
MGSNRMTTLNGTVYFAQFKHLHAWEITTHKQEKISPLPEAIISDIALSRNGSQIIFNNQERDAGIWSLDRQSRKVRQLTGNALDSWPALSPNGEQLVFSRRGALMLYHLHTNKEETLTSPQGSEGYLDPQHHPVGDICPSWSPDGRHLIFTRSPLKNSAPQLWKLDVQTKREHCLTQGRRGIHSGSWSPDGRWIACLRNTKTSKGFHLGDLQTGELLLISSDNPWLQRTCGNCLSDYPPIWSPSGEQIVTLQNKGSKTLLTLLDRNGKLLFQTASPTSGRFTVAFNKQ